MGMRLLEFWEGGEIDTILGYLVLFACNTSVTDECCDKLFGVAPPLDMSAQLQSIHRKTLQV